MKKNKVILALGVILLIAAFFRFYQLNQVPPSPSLDEVSIGWNAYSILKTGKDEYGYRLPVLLRAYDDWRPALYVYFVIPFVKFFGLSPAAVRFPAALLGTLTVLLTYFLVKELFPGKRLAYQVSLITSFLLAISPWHIYISRLGHEVGAGLTFSLLGGLFFLKSVNQKRPAFLFGSAVFFALSLYTYQSEKIFAPFLLLVLVLIFRKQLLKFKKELVLAGLLGLILLLPIIKASLSPGGLIRFQGSSVFSGHPALQQTASLRLARDFQENRYLGLFFDNQIVVMGLEILRAYFSHFDLSWLFFNRGGDWHKISGMGLLHLWELPLLLIGTYQLLAGKLAKRNKILILSWILIAPLPASIATEVPHAMRTFNILPMPQILIAIGVVTVIAKIQSVRRKRFRNLIFGLSFLLLLLNLGYLHHNYFVNFPYEERETFQYPLAQAIDYATKVENNYQKIAFSSEENCLQSYMFYLFFTRYDPETYLAQGGTISGGFRESHQIGKYEFRLMELGREKIEKNTLYVENTNDIPEIVTSRREYKLLKELKGIKIFTLE